MTLKEKILIFLKEEGIKKTDFFDLTGLSPSNFKGNGMTSELGGDKIVKILSVYPSLSSEWLLKDMGPMLSTGQKDSPDPDVPYKIYNEIKEENKILHEKLLEKSEEIGKLKAKIDGVREENPIYHIPAHAVAEQSPDYIHPIINKK